MPNDLIRDAITDLNSSPSDATRIDLYRQLSQGLLLVVVAELPTGLAVGETLLDRETKVSMLTTSLPNGGDAILAFTDPESLRARVPNAKYLAIGSLDLLRLVTDGGYDALVLNAAGPWAGVPRDDVQRILDGVWPATDT